MWNLVVGLCETFHFSWSNRFATVTTLKLLWFLIFLKFDRYFNGQFWSKSLNMHIFVFSGSRSVRIDILFSNLRHFRF